KFTPEGGVIEITTTANATHGVLCVRDSGCGIAPEFLPHVFDHFRQASSSPTRRYGGLGLGLTIVRHIVETQNGHITAASDGQGKGAAFTMELPRAQVGWPPTVS